MRFIIEVSAGGLSAYLTTIWRRNHKFRPRGFALPRANKKARLFVEEGRLDGLPEVG
jgi:hypothetical protein